MDYIEAIVGFAGGVLSGIISKKFRSKSEHDEFLLELIKTLRSEVDRMHKELETVRKEYDNKILRMQREYNDLLDKYNQLKKDLQNHKENK